MDIENGAGASLAVVDQAGKVGIGTASPAGHLHVGSEGSFATPALALGNSKGFYGSGNSLYVKTGNNVAAVFYHVASLGLRSDSEFSFSNSSDPGAATKYIKLVTEGNGLLSQRNGSNAQRYRLYNTYTDASNYERLTIGHSSNVITFASEAAGTGETRSFNFSGGNVGVGTTSPAEKLEVNGGIRLNAATAQPACDSDRRGTIWVERGDPGVADVLQVCLKSSVDTYGWIPVVTGG